MRAQGAEGGARRPRLRDAIEWWIRFCGALAALLVTTAGIVYGVGGWILDRQSRSLALAEHRVLEARVEEAKVELRREIKQSIDSVSLELAKQRAEAKDDQRETQRRIDSLVRRVGTLATSMEAP